jgi:hypothetical protein
VLPRIVKLSCVSKAVAALCLLEAAPAPAELRAAFDWSMPPRFAVPDPPAPEGHYEIYAEVLHPAAWRVDFDACASEDAVAYEWTIDGVPAADSGICDGFHWDFAAEGAHLVALRVLDGAGGVHETARWIRVEDRLIFGLGDSYGSGEGAPDLPIAPEKIELANAMEVALDAAIAARNAAAAVYAQRLLDLNVTQAEIQAVLAALGRYERAKIDFANDCPALTVACAQATAELSAAATALGVELVRVELAHLSIDSSGTIRSALNNLLSVVTLAVDLAATALDAAEAAVVAAQQDLEEARAELRGVWQNRRCHRSSWSAQAEAARRLEAGDPKSSVTFVHLACSGATTWEGIVGTYGGIEDDGPAFDPQLDVLARLALKDDQQPELGLERPVDAIVLSIGGNDVNFAGVIERCITFQSCPTAPVLDATAAAGRAAWCAMQSSYFASRCVEHLGLADGLEAIDAEQLFQEGTDDGFPNGLDDLPANYAAIADELAASGLGAAPVLLTSYPDITRDELGDPCGWHALDDAATRQRNLIGIDTAEMTWAGGEVAAPLADTMAGVADALDWRFVGGAAELFRLHGYCSTDAWVVRLQESFPTQGQPWGVAHPNYAGHDAWAGLIATAVPEPGATAGALLALAALARLARGRVTCRRGLSPLTTSS